MASSASEGEILEASSAQSPSKDMLIDRGYRKSPSSEGSRRSRSRSRSPYRQSKKRRRDDHSSRDERDGRRFKVHYEEKRPRHNRRQSRSRSRSPYRHKEKDSFTKETKPSKHSEAPSIRSFKLQTNHQVNDSVAKSEIPIEPTTAPVNNAPEDSLAVEPVDEAALIEERRKRREALKAKLKTQPTPLLAQALHFSADSLPTPSTQVATPQPSPSVASPQSFSHSPRAVDTPEDFHETSAADYDPTADMAEDRARHDHRFHDDSDPEQPQDESATGPEVDAKKKDEEDDFDMFADEDDDDMFTALPTKKSKSAGTLQSKDTNTNLADNWDDVDGYYRIILGELLDDRYRVQANLGKGMFSAVVRAWDQGTSKLVAIKVIRSQESMKKAGLKEIDILEKLAVADPSDRKHVIRLERHFDHKGHLCMVFENLNINLREVLKKYGRDVGINLRAVRLYAQQMFLALSLMKKCNIIHADLKPDNMLVNEERSMLKVCDLGSAGDASENDITPYLVSRFYRAPEIMLGMPYDFGIDMWSIGCTLYELYTGKILFMGRNNNQMLKSIMECRGRFSPKMLKKSEFAGLHFDENLQFRSMEKDKVTNKDVIRMMNFVRPTRDLKSRLMRATKNIDETEAKELPLFIDLLDRCLALNPEKRITPDDALKHPFVNRSKG